jgi:hypothetical protein
MREIKFTNWWAYKKQGSDIRKTLSQMDLHNKTDYSMQKVLDENLLVEAAKSAHNNQMIYFVTVFENDKPICFLEINKGFYRVNFLDEHLRNYMIYDFYGSNYVEVYADKLFLGQIVLTDFKGDTDKVLKITSHIFKADGSFHITERDLTTNEQIDSEAKNKIDVSQNWEEYPEFGKYDLLTRKEREATIN